MASKACVLRLQKEYRALLKEPLPGVAAHPFPSNLLEWHFVLEGGKGTEYEGGVYHGIMTFPAAYPYRPPSLQMLTPSGRFAVGQKICLSNTDYHAETWNPAWGAGTILVGLLSFMSETAHTTGSISTSRAEKRRLAAASLDFNMRSARFRRLFPDYCEKHAQRQAANAQARSSHAAKSCVAGFES
ncbi:hypothetical protein WJX81_006103 [Elliptochloris bilobata]|uniref:UBC core domain-containing protein n=1 Tax=Elliptochloris bilobata TaxID=381761 RepID=A0AAW1SF13_9CHLO